MAYDSIDMAGDVCNALETAGLARFDLADDDESTGNQRAFAAVEKALADRAALLAALDKMWTAYGNNQERHCHDGDNTWTDADHAEWQEAAGAASTAIGHARGNQLHTVARPDDPMRDHNERLEFAAAQSGEE